MRWSSFLPVIVLGSIAFACISPKQFPSDVFNVDLYEVELDVPGDDTPIPEDVSDIPDLRHDAEEILDTQPDDGNIQDTRDLPHDETEVTTDDVFEVKEVQEIVSDAVDVTVDTPVIDSGPPPGCEYNDTECNDNNPCTDDFWCTDPWPDCYNKPNNNLCGEARCQMGGFFDAVFCIEGQCLDQKWKSCDDGNPCTWDGCDPELEGGCDHMFNEEPCDDGNPCTGDDSCTKGTCAGTPISCACPTGDCSEYEDDDLCNGTLFCGTDLQCKVDLATIVSCPEVDEPCKAQVCQPDTGKCIDVSINQGKPCAGSKCDADGFHAASYCLDGQCPEQVASACNDNNVCNGIETCDPLVGCKPGTPLLCDDGEVCTIDDCNAITGCDYSQNNDDHVCATSYCDALTFYEEMTCFGGSCPVSTTQECDVDDGNVCTYPACDDELGCVQANPAGSIECAVAKCEGGDHYPAVNCDGMGTCPDQVPVDCNDANECTDDSCVEGSGCVHVNNTGLCGTSRCETGDFYPELYCSNGACPAQVLKDCDDGNVCTDDSCDEAAGCVNVNNTIPCAAAKCEGSDFHPEVSCKDGACPQPVPENCNDGNVCTGTETCDPSSGCVLGEPLNCDDGLPCDGTEICEPNKGCTKGDPPQCDDDDPCDGIEFCLDPVGCQEGTPPPCAHPDDNVCDGVEDCDSGISGGCYIKDFPLNCDDSKVCTIDSCHPIAGCQHQLNDGYVCGQSYCDGLTLYEKQTCSKVDCPPYTTLDCNVDDGNVCTYPACNKTAGCQQANHPKSHECAPAKCENGDYYPAAKCDGAGSCPDQVPADCDDVNVCTDDSCDEVQGCLHVAANEGLECLTFLGKEGTCSDGECSIECTLDGDCDDEIECTVDSCDMVTGQCDHVVQHLVCDDTNECTDDSCVVGTGCVHVDNSILCAAATCLSGVFHADAFCGDGTCPAQESEDCDDGNACTDDSCDPSTGCANTANTSTICHTGYCETLLWYDGVNCAANGICPDQLFTQDCSDGEVCTVDLCDPLTGCDNSQNNDGWVCGPAYCDSLTFYEEQTCSGGSCPIYTTQDCDVDDGNSCTYPACTKQAGCSQANQPQSHECAAARCENGDYYPAVSCDGAGNCPDQVPVDCDDGNPCTSDSCDPVVGCVNTADTSVVCHSGYCDTLLWYGETNCSAGGSCPSQVVTQDCDDGEICTVDACDPATGCDNTQNNDGFVCGPSYCDALTFYQEQSCSGGTCPDYTTLDCDADDGNECTYPVCDDQSGCSQANQPSSHECAPAKCENDDFYKAVTCTGSGTCSDQLPQDCDDGKSCTSDTCDPGLGCLHSPTNEGQACVTHLGQDGKCTNGVCKTECTLDDECDDEFDCTADSCNTVSGKCEHVPQQQLCDDVNQCTDDSCVEGSGCVHVNNTVLCGTSRCENGDFYAQVFCSNGSCPAQVPKDCDDGRICTDDSCDDVNGCTHSNNTVPCASAKCEGTNYFPGVLCANGTCPPQVPQSCNDNNVCNGTETCDPSSGCVQGTPLGCNDNDPCNGTETCHPTQGCLPGTPLVCDDGDKCNGTETCVTGTGCQGGTPLVCEDGDVCNGVKSCDPGIGCFMAQLPLNCDDANVCTDDTCDPATGCGNTNNTLQCAYQYCEDGTYYPTLYCDAGACPAPTPVDCDDGNICTDDTCDPDTGCVNTNNTEPCNDADPCTRDDACSSGHCAGTHYACDSPGQCETSTGATCNGDGTCTYPTAPMDAMPCEDGNLCTEGETCAGGTCIGGSPVSCDDGNPCTDDSCDSSVGCLHPVHVGGCPSGFPPCEGTCIGTECIYAIESCNAKDDDCDGFTDEDWPAKGTPCDGGDSDMCPNGTFTCNGAGTGLECVNEDPDEIPEICNGKDDDCDGTTDESPIDLCPGGQACIDGQCKTPQVTDGFVAIPAGTFWMGSPQSSTCPSGYPGVCEDESTYNDDETLHYVKLTHGFEMQAHEVTQGEFETVMGWNPSYFGPNGSGTSCGTTCPVEYVSWYDAAAYANQKSIGAGKTTCYVFADVECEDGTAQGSNYMACMNTTQKGIDSATVTLNGVSTPYDCTGYRLPTESEWEYAARAGSSTAFHPSPGNDGTITYEGREPLDPNLDQIGWYGGNSTASYSNYSCSSWFTGATTCGPQPTGGKEANAWGLFDMSGNVWEWAWDGWGSYPGGTLSSPSEDPVVPATGSPRVLRGGSWGNFAQYCRSAYRYYYSPGKRFIFLGLRLARSM